MNMKRLNNRGKKAVKNVKNKDEEAKKEESWDLF